jgi:alpha-glucuronidase
MRAFRILACAVLLAGVTLAGSARAEDGHGLWLRYRPVAEPAAAVYRQQASELVVSDNTPTISAAQAELVKGLSAMLGKPPAVVPAVMQDGAVVLAVAGRSKVVSDLKLPVAALGKEGFLIRGATWQKHKITVIAGNTDVGVLYGAFRYLRQIQTSQSTANLDIHDMPRVGVRVLNHWDTLVRFGANSAGMSIWDWAKLPAWRDPIYTEYARANASIGINAVVPNQINAEPEMFTPLYLRKVAALADIFRPYGIKIYLSARVTAPVQLGGLKTADPLDPEVKKWWAAKVDEIYTYIPDFGGFLVKADSEGEPGPHDYKRTQADGANVLADALKPHGGIVMWRAFVYSNNPNWDRVKQAYDEFKPLDGKFRDNVIVQVKNGPLDFQPREPFSPLFGATPNTNTGMEVEVVKEYLGGATHLFYLGAYWEEVLQTDTYAKGKGSTVASVIDGTLFKKHLTGFAGVANIGTDRDWCGSTFNQANWYAFGRLAWNPHDSARAIAADWAAMTFTPDKAFVGPVVDMMMASREADVDFMMPLGLAHQFATGHHYGPEPWGDSAPRADWRPVTYNGADKGGIGVDRTASGTNYVSQYAPPVAAGFSDLSKIDDKYLLWFHHVPWDYHMKSGAALWEDLVHHFDRGVVEVVDMEKTWAAMKPYVDDDRFTKTAVFLSMQENEAKWWRDSNIAYFQSVSGLPLPAGVAPPEHTLDYYKALNKSLRIPVYPF